MKRILIPTDFSKNFTKALTYAGEIAQRTGAVIYLLHVIEPVIDRIRQPFPLHEKLQEEIVKARLADLQTTKRSMAGMYPGLTIETKLTKGTVTTSILDCAENIQADLIVMGTQGATGLKEIYMGTVAAGTIGRTQIPVLAVPNEYVYEVPDCILFATNHFEENKNLLNKIVEMANLFSAAIHVAVFVDTDTAEATDYIYNTRQLNHYLKFLKNAYPDVVFKAELLEGSEFEETIETYDTKNEVDIIVMITYPKSFWEKLMKKSTTKKMAFHSKIPVLAIPAQ
jgi:nucleotide-binding universal stress UspA family protein